MSPANEGAGSVRRTGRSRVILRADGASRGNPGPAAIAYVVEDGRGRELASEGRFVGEMTNNEAEYRALIAGLEKAATYQPAQVDVRLDSELVVRQLKGAYRVRAPHLVPLHAKARALLASFPAATVRHVARRQNARADELANAALDQAHNRQA